MIRTLSEERAWLRTPGSPEMDALREEGALLEAQLLDVWIRTLESRAGLLFDVRGALQLQEGNTAVIFVHSVESAQWQAERRLGKRTAWNVVGSEPSYVHGRFTLDLSFVPDGKLVVVGRGAEFYVGEVPAIPARIPDFVVDDEATILAGMPGWESLFRPLRATVMGEGLK